MGEKRKDNIDDITKKMKKQKKDKNLKKERSELKSDVVTDKTNELPPKDEPKKFHISLKMQSSLTMEKPQSVEGKKGPKIIIAKSKKEKDDESKKPTKRLNKVSFLEIDWYLSVLTKIRISIYCFILASEEEAAAGSAHRGDDPRDQGPGQGAPVPEAVGRGQRQLEV